MNYKYENGSKCQGQAWYAINLEWASRLEWTPIDYSLCTMAYSGKIFGEVYNRSCSGSGAEPPGAREFSKICKKVIKKMAKFHYFSLFFNKFKTKRWIFSHLVQTTIGLEIFENILKIFVQNSITKWNF